MKKYILPIFFILLKIGNIFGAIDKRTDISIQYEKCFKYRTIKFGVPYCIQITNLSDAPVRVVPSLITAPLVTYQEVAEALHNEYKMVALYAALTTIGNGSVSYLIFKEMKGRYNPLNTGLAKINLGFAGLSGLTTAYFLYKLATETKEILESKILHSPIIILPGKFVQKLVWLKNPSDSIKINFDAVEVLK